MNYIQYIEESKSWTCPKSGVWKVICVGGGASGGYYITSSKITAQHTGGTTRAVSRPPQSPCLGGREVSCVQ